MSIIQQIEKSIQEREAWVLRRQKGIPTNKRLFVLTCMDERVNIEEALGLQPGDAHIFRNAGGLVTDDVIRSAALTTNFFETKEIIVVTHTECGMMMKSGKEIVKALQEKLGIDLSTIQLDPSLPELSLTDPKAIERWFKTFESIDEITVAQVELLRNHPLIPKDVTIAGYIYEVETGKLRRPFEMLSRRVNSHQEMTGNA
ncbi:MAG: carbonic anhydrase [Armatimonadetes bacterium]|nr:carbonic anhydrase [Armatimonadota bacterium]MDW8029184.1 carbonic anhydrase [Armatimonadota bacterium]